MANQVPTPDDKPRIPLVASPANTDDVQVTRYSKLDALLKTEEPAAGMFTALACKCVVESCNKNKLGTHRPSEMMVGLDDTNTYLFFIPVKPNTPGATEVKHGRGTMLLNLYNLFFKLHRLVPPDIREYYAVKPTPGEVTIGDVKGWGVYVDLTQVIKEKITRLSDEERAARLAKLRQTLAKKKAAKQAEQESAPGAESPAEEQE